MRQLLGLSFKLRLGIALTLFIILLAAIEPLLRPMFIGDANPKSYGTLPPMLDPSWEHPLGTSAYGQDMFILLLYGLRDSLMIGGLAGMMAVSIGIVVGFTAGYKGGLFDTILRSVTDMVLVIPTLPLLIILVAMVRVVDFIVLAVMLAIFGWAHAARVIRAQVLSMRERPYIELAQLNDEGDAEIIATELVPNLLPYLGLVLAGGIIGAILAETALELIGFGTGTVWTLGYLIYQALAAGMVSMGRYEAVAAPAGMLILLFLALNLINMGLEEVYNPRLRQKAAG